MLVKYVGMLVYMYEYIYICFAYYLLGKYVCSERDSTMGGYCLSSAQSCRAMSLPPSCCLHTHGQCHHRLLLLPHGMQILYQPQLIAPLLHAPSHMLDSPAQPRWQMEPAHGSPLPGRCRVGRHGVDMGLSSALCSLPWEKEGALTHGLCLSSPWNHSSCTQWRHHHQPTIAALSPHPF